MFIVFIVLDRLNAAILKIVETAFVKCKIVFTYGLWTFLVISATAAFGQMEFRKSWFDRWVDLIDVTLDENSVYLLDYPDFGQQFDLCRIFELDLSLDDPVRSKVVTTHCIPSAKSIQASFRNLYITSDSVLYIFDTDTHPHLINSYEIQGGIKSFLSHENCLFISDFNEILRIYSIDGNRRIEELSSIDLGITIRGLYYNDEQDLLGVAGSRFILLNVSNLRELETLGVADYNCNELVINNQYAYLAAGNLGLLTIDISNPEDMRRTSIFNPERCVGEKVELYNNTLLFDHTVQDIEWDEWEDPIPGAAIAVLNLEYPAEPNLISEETSYDAYEYDVLEASATTWIVAGENLWDAHWYVDVHSQDELFTGILHPIRGANRFNINGNHLVIMIDSLRVFRFVRPDSLEQCCVFRDTYYNGVVIQDNFYTYTFGMAFAFDIFTPMRPSEIWRHSAQIDWDFRGIGTNNEMLMLGETAYAHSEPVFWDITEGGEPVNPRSVVTGRSAQKSVWEGDLFAAYSHDEDVVTLVNLSQENLEVSGTIEVIDEINSCWIHDDHIYLCDNSFRIFDIREPQRPREIEQEVRIYSDCVTGSGDYIWACGNNPTLFIFDVSNPEEPTIIHRINMTSHLLDVAVNGSLFYALTYDGLALFDCSDILSVHSGDRVMASELLGLAISPNPFNSKTSISYTLDRDGFVTLKLYDLSGREVASLVNERLSAGHYSTIWNAEDLPAGVYLLRLNAGVREKTTKLVLIR